MEYLKILVSFVKLSIFQNMISSILISTFLFLKISEQMYVYLSVYILPACRSLNKAEGLWNWIQVG